MNKGGHSQVELKKELSKKYRVTDGAEVFRPVAERTVLSAD